MKPRGPGRAASRFCVPQVRSNLGTCGTGNDPVTTVGVPGAGSDRGSQATSDAPDHQPEASVIGEPLTAQRETLENLRLWWNDWATTLRPAFDMREQVSLGLTEVKFSSKKSATDPSLALPPFAPPGVE